VIQNNNAQLVHAFFHARLGLHWSQDFRGVIHVPDECRNEMMGMDHVAIAVGYNSFVGRTCCIHVVIQRPELLTRRIVREAFEFPFVVCNCEAVLALVDSTNEAALNFDAKLGFIEVARVPNGGTEGDLVVLQMLRSDCRWLRKPH
jgi:RimJ/RimL family protein N-acetyltransferase